MQPIIEIRLAMVAHGYTPIPVMGKKPPLTEWQKIDASRAPARGLGSQLAGREQHRNPYQANADARS